MKKEKSVPSIVFTHIFTTSIIIPFFGLLSGYFISKFLANKLEPNLLVIFKDIIFIIIFFLGVKYSLSQIEKRINVTNPINSAKYSIIIFGLLIFSIFIIQVYSNLTILNIGYNFIYYGMIFGIFFILTQKYFKKLTH